jgi:hypothetical protein
VQLDACTWSLTYFIRGTGTHNFRRSTQCHDFRITATRGSLQSVTEQAMRCLKEAAVQLTGIPSGQLAPIASVWSHIPD